MCLSVNLETPCYVLKAVQKKNTSSNTTQRFLVLQCLSDVCLSCSIVWIYSISLYNVGVSGNFSAQSCMWTVLGLKHALAQQIYCSGTILSSNMFVAVLKMFCLTSHKIRVCFEQLRCCKYSKTFSV